MRSTAATGHMMVSLSYVAGGSYSTGRVMAPLSNLAGDVMGRPGELGQVKQGLLADLLLVDGDPLADVDILQDRDRLLAIMKDGVFHKEPLREASSVTLAAE